MLTLIQREQIPPRRPLGPAKPFWVGSVPCIITFGLPQPKFGRYEIVEEVVDLGEGALTSRPVRKYANQLSEKCPLLVSPHD